MNWYIDFAKKYLGVKYIMTLSDFIKFMWLPFTIIMGIVFSILSCLFK